MIDIAIVTAPRVVPTLEVSVKSLRDAGVDWHIDIFAEPNSEVKNISNCTVYFNKIKYGLFKNYDQALRYLIEHGDANYVLVLSDDFIYSSKLLELINYAINDKSEWGYYSLFTHAFAPHNRALPKGWSTQTAGIDEAWGGAYLMKKKVADMVVKDSFYKQIMKERNQTNDGTISEVLKRKKLKMWYHNPSFTYTIGHFSTVNHKRVTDGLNFQA